MKVLLNLLLFSLSSTLLANEFNIRTENPGFYSIKTSELANLSIDYKKSNLGQFNLNKGSKPYFFKSGKNKLQKEDEIVFFADMLHSDFSYQHPHDDFNGFDYSLSKDKANTKDWFFNKRAHKKLAECTSIRTSSHFENNKLLIRVNTREYKEAPELWYWHKLSTLDKKGFSYPLDLSEVENLDNIEIKAVFRSTNIDRKAKDMPHHEVQLSLNGKVFKTLNWDKKTQFITENISIPKELFKLENNQLNFLVPKRKSGKNTIIDIVMLDYFEIIYDIKPENIKPTHRLFSQTDCKVELSDQQFAYSVNDKKFAYKTIALTSQSKVHIGNYESLIQPRINKVETLNFKKSEVDYLMISHKNFIDGTMPLADFHRKQGKNVEVVDVNHIYQNYSAGVRELYAIKDFIKDVYQSGDGRLKHVLLVGDSSWDWRDSGKNNQYGKWASRILPKNKNFTNFPHQKYKTDKQFRDFIPTGQYHSSEGHSASDNWFASFIPEKNMKGEDYIPDVAIGRFPVSNNDELAAMVDKTINYSQNTVVGPWKSRVLWITNAEKRFQNSSKTNSNIIGKYGVMADTVFPPEMDGDNVKIQNDLTQAFDQGELIVHFVGHGGKSIWRIGPPDLKKNRDLFTLDHISKLKNNNKLPFVMSMSCYSAPFDHPFADSIGEKFIREPDVGAVAVLAASWRNSPNSTFSRYILENLFKNPEHSLGQAILEAKRYYKGRTMVEMYNLLGDPAVKLAIPTLKMNSDLNADTLTLDVETNSFKGNALLEVLDEHNNVISKREVPLNSKKQLIALQDDEKSCSQGRVYAWDSEQNIDAMSYFECSKD